MFRKDLEREVSTIAADKLTHFHFRNRPNLRVMVVQIECGCGGLGMGVEILLPTTGIANVDSYCTSCCRPLLAEVEFN